MSRRAVLAVSFVAVVTEVACTRPTAPEPVVAEPPTTSPASDPAASASAPEPVAAPEPSAVAPAPSASAVASAIPTTQKTLPKAPPGHESEVYVKDGRCFYREKVSMKGFKCPDPPSPCMPPNPPPPYEVECP